MADYNHERQDSTAQRLNMASPRPETAKTDSSSGNCPAKNTAQRGAPSEAMDKKGSDLLFDPASVNHMGAAIIASLAKRLVASIVAKLVKVVTTLTDEDALEQDCLPSTVILS